MRLVVDANIIFSALIAGRLSSLLLSRELELIAPHLLLEEIRNNKEEVKVKSHLTDADFELLLMLLEKRIRFVPFEEFIEKFDDAEKLLREHKKDVPYIALALQYNCPVWTYEKRFAGKITMITTKEVRNFLRR